MLSTVINSIACLGFRAFSVIQTLKFVGEQGWRSGESTRLPPVCPGFNSRTRRDKWAEFVGSLFCSERFSPGTPVFPSPQKPTI